jgi:hypothetical protein
MLKVEHIGIAVHRCPGPFLLFETLLKTPCYKKEEVAVKT